MFRIVVAGLLALLSFSASVHAQSKKRPPNIILIMADDLGYECIGANGSTSYKTPWLDKLAAGGMRFEHCYSQPLCTPTRSQLMTGIYNQRNYIRFGYLAPNAVTFAKFLRQMGYATCIVGKWQLGGGFERPAHFGFDEYCLWQLTIRKSRFPNPLIEQNGKVKQYTNGEYGPDIVCDYLCDFMERKKDTPFLAYFPMILTHSPFVPTPDSKAYNPKARKEQAGQNKKFFGDMVTYMDKLIGKIATRVDKLGLRENTMIVFLGDNGTGKGIVSMMGDRRILGGKGETTNAGTHVPLIVNWPGTIPAGKVSQDLIDTTDFMPTMLDAAGGEVPAKLKIDGQSFYPQLLGKKGTPREWSYCWYARNGGPRGAEFARTQWYKLYRDGRFLDLKADPLEKSPLTKSDIPAPIAMTRQRLQAVLDRFEGTRAKLDPKQKD